jgi:hypothetical protein
MSRNTEGSWSYAYSNDTGPNDGYFVEFYEISKGHDIIGRIDSEDDARLIAAAPDLLEALVVAVAFIKSHCADPDITEEMRKCYSSYLDAKPEDAIAKARGEA